MFCPICILKELAKAITSIAEYIDFLEYWSLFLFCCLAGCIALIILLRYQRNKLYKEEKE